MFDDELAAKKLGIQPRMDDDCGRPYAVYEAEIQQSEVADIYEVRQPASGFAFESPEIVYHKKDGIWLPYHELGAPLEEDEWL